MHVTPIEASEVFKTSEASAFLIQPEELLRRHRLNEKVYTINDPKKISKYIGDKVTITGTNTGDVVTIEKVSK